MPAVEEIDPSDDRAFDEWFDVLHATDLERWPDKPGWQRVERLAWALDRDGPEEHRCLVARGPDGRVLGVADLEMFRRENRHLARIDVRVLPESRRQGVGTALVLGAEQAAREQGRSEIGGMDEVPVRADFEDTATGFARRLGFAPAQSMVRRELVMPIDPGRMVALAGSPRAMTPGYSVMTFADRWPDPLVADRAELGRRMSTDVPVGDQQLDEEVWDEARVRQIESRQAAMGRAKVITAARDDASGNVVAFTEVVVPLAAPESAWQHDTLVMREHRGHNLGFAIKLATAAAVADQHPRVRTVGTWNAAENRHMIAINDEFGFEVVSNSTYWLKKIETT